MKKNINKFVFLRICLILSSLLIFTACFEKLLLGSYVDTKIEAESPLEDVVLTSTEFSNLISVIEVELDFSDFHNFTDSVRKVVQKYTVHGENESVCDSVSCIPQIAQSILNYISNEEEVFHALCSHRSLLTSMILKKYGYETRLINLENQSYQGHVFLEVKNPEGSWEVVDPDYNIYYIKDGNRLSARNLVMYLPEEFVPCSEAGCSWELAHGKEGFSPLYLRDNNYFGFAFIWGLEGYFNPRDYVGVFDFQAAYLVSGLALIEEFN